MAKDGYGDPSGRRQRSWGRRDQGSCTRQHSVERALSASTLLPTFAFAGLGTLTVILVAQMSLSPLGAVVDPSARDGGRAVTMPRMSVSIAPPLARAFAPRSHRTARGFVRPQASIATAPAASDVLGLPHALDRASLLPAVALVVLPGAAEEAAAERATQRAHGTSTHAVKHAKTLQAPKMLKARKARKAPKVPKDVKALKDDKARGHATSDKASKKVKTFRV